MGGECVRRVGVGFFVVVCVALRIKRDYFN